MYCSMIYTTNLSSMLKVQQLQPNVFFGQLGEYIKENRAKAQRLQLVNNCNQMFETLSHVNGSIPKSVSQVIHL